MSLMFQAKARDNIATVEKTEAKKKKKDKNGLLGLSCDTYVSNTSVCKLFVFEKNTWYHLTQKKLYKNVLRMQFL